jgi:hypothetical protein
MPPRRIKTDEEDCTPADEHLRTLSRNSLKTECGLRSERGFGQYTEAKMGEVVSLRWFPSHVAGTSEAFETISRRRSQNAPSTHSGD